MVTPIATGIYTGLGLAACAGVAAGVYAYASRWPASRLFGTALTAPARPGELALTFDDGPNATWTPKLLDILATHNIRATFFVLGGRARRAARQSPAGTCKANGTGRSPHWESLLGPSQLGAQLS
jgi:peptidoglycan/xylan/chitin deacetylase (PgdA/CDA1 family)